MRRTHGPDSNHSASCFGCRVLTVGVAPSAMPSRHPEAAQVGNVESGWDKDIPAYKRLRKQGLQPKRVDGAAQVEARAEHPAEITMGKKLTADGRKMAEEMGV